jgi:hypothetical protein
MSLTTTGVSNESANQLLNTAQLSLSSDNIVEQGGSPRYMLDSSVNKKHFHFGSNRPVCILPSPFQVSPYQNGLYSPGVAGQDASITHTAVLNDLDDNIVFTTIVTPAAFGANQYIVSKWDTGTTGSFALRIDDDSSLRLQWVDTNPTLNEVVSTETLIDAGFVAGDTIIIQCLFVVSTGATAFYASTLEQGLFGYQLGTGITFGATSVQTSTEDLQFGARTDNSPQDCFNGWIHLIRLDNGTYLSSTNVVYALFYDETPGTSSFLEENGLTVNINELATTTNDPLFLPKDASLAYATGNNFTNGAGYCYLPGETGDYIYLADAASNSITGDLCMIAYIRPNDWTPSAVNVIASKYTVTGNQRSWELAILTDGKIRFRHSTDGTAGTVVTNTSTVAPTINNGDSLAIAVTIDVDNGASGHDVKFYTATDPNSSFTQLGTTVTTAGATSIFNSTAPVTISGISLGATTPYAGSIASYALYSGFPSQFGGAATPAHSLTIDGKAGSSITMADDITGTWTIARDSAGVKSTVVDANVIVTGADDYLEHPDDAYFDIDDTQNFSVIHQYRHWTEDIYGMNKIDNAFTNGWAMATNTTAGLFGTIEASTLSLAIGPANSEGGKTILTGVRVAGTSINIYKNTTLGTPSAVNTSQDTTNAYAVRIGASSGGTPIYSEQEFFNALFYTRALTIKEISAIVRQLA